MLLKLLFLVVYDIGFEFLNFFQKNLKKLLTFILKYDIIIKH